MTNGKKKSFDFTVFNDDSFKDEESIVRNNIVFNKDNKTVSIAPPRVPTLSMLHKDAKAQFYSLSDNFTFNIIEPIPGEKFQIFYDQEWYVVYADGNISMLKHSPSDIIKVKPFSTDERTNTYIFSFVKNKNDITLTHIFSKETKRFLASENMIAVAYSYGFDENVSIPVDRTQTYGELMTNLHRRDRVMMVQVDSGSDMFCNLLFAPKKTSFSEKFNGDVSDPDTKKIANMMYPVVERALLLREGDKNHPIGSALHRNRSSKKIANLIVPYHLRTGKKTPSWLEEQIDQIKKRISNRKHS